MGNNNLVGAIVGVTMSILILALILMPAITDTVKTTETLDNSNFARYDMKELETGDVWTLSGYDWSYDSEFLTNKTNDGYSLVLADTLVLNEDGSSRGSYNSNSVSSFTIASDTALNVNSASVTYSKGYGAVQSGDLILKDHGSEAFILKDTELWSSGSVYLSSDSSSLVFFTLSGNIEDGFTVTAVKGQNSTVTDITTEVVSVNAVAVDGYKDTYAITSVDVEISGTWADTSVSKERTVSDFIMPKTVTAELSNHLGTAEVSLMNSIPILLIMGILIGAVGAIFIRRRSD